MANTLTTNKGEVRERVTEDDFFALPSGEPTVLDPRAAKWLGDNLASITLREAVSRILGRRSVRTQNERDDAADEILGTLADYAKQASR